jgi:hypothetical protein
MFLPKTNSTDFTPAPAGTHIAMCVRVIDLGTQTVDWQGTSKLQRKIMIVWELPAEVMDNGKPYLHSQRYTFSSNEKSTLRKHLEGWRGKKFSDAELSTFDLKSVLGKACSLIVSHSARGDKIYANTDGIGPLPKGVPAPEPVNPITYFSLEADRFDVDVFNSLSAGIKTVIMRSPEYAERIGASLAHHDLEDVF